MVNLFFPMNFTLFSSYKENTLYAGKHFFFLGFPFYKFFEDFGVFNLRGEESVVLRKEASIYWRTWIRF